MEPGARVVLTHGLRSSPFSTAFLASRAAPIITEGFEVLVHEVIAAIDDRAVVDLELRAVLQRDPGRVRRAVDPAGALVVVPVVRRARAVAALGVRGRVAGREGLVARLVDLRLDAVRLLLAGNTGLVVTRHRSRRR